MSRGESNDSSSNNSSNFSKTWELNIYELNRIPHEIIYDDREIAVSPKILQNELMCPICLDILKKTMTTKECLHRFCQDCIITALRAGNKECPTCRKKLISKRSLRRDPNFDGIIAKIYPNREEYDALHEKVLEKLNKKHLTSMNANASVNNSKSTKRAQQQQQQQAEAANSNAPTSSTTTVAASSSNQSTEVQSSTSNAAAVSTNGAKEPVKESTTHATASSSANHRGIKRNVINSDDSDMESRTSTEQSSTHFQNDTDEIELVLKPHPTKETVLTSKRFLKTTSNATMNHLSKYLWTRLFVEANNPSQLNDGNSHTGTSSASNVANNNTTESAGDEFQLFISANEKLPSAFQLLSQNLTLEQVIDKYWKQNRPIEIFYFNNSNAKSTANLPNDLNTNSNGSSGTISTTTSSQH